MVLAELAKNIIERAQAIGATDADVLLSRVQGFSVAVRMGETETIEHHQDKGIGLTVYIGHQTGTASSTDFSDKAIQATIEKAYNIAKFTQEDKCAGLADKTLMATDLPDLALYYPWDLSPEKGIELAKEYEALARTYDNRITNSEGVAVDTHQSEHLYANSHGFVGEMATTSHSVSISLIAQEKGMMERDYDYTAVRDSHDLVSPKMLAKAAAERTVHRLGARRLTTRRVPVIFEARLAKGLLSHFLSAISGKNLYRQSSFLLDHLEKQVFPEFITIGQKPYLKKAMGSTAFDDEGVQTYDLDYVEQGILKSYVLNSYSARKLGMQTTGNAGGVHNLFISTSDVNLSQLLKKMDTGLLVTELIGQGVNIVTGDYSRGAFGYWVENGEIQYPVHEITIAGNLKDMLRNIQAVANDVDHRGNIHTGSILIDNMMVAG